MRPYPPAPKFGNCVRLTIVALFVTTLTATAYAQVAVGPNVNMGGGPATFTPPSTIIGDPFLQRQNEPSIAVSSRNPCHLLAGANDYRAVDLEEAAGEVGDAWLGVFKSFDCGATWTSTLLPGHKLDSSIAGMASPLKGLAAAADATVRAGTSGLFYYSGIAFNRGENQPGKVFVARFIDNNNKDGGDPIQYLGAKQIDLGTSGQFLDKPWIIADVPRNGSTCTINGRSVPAGPVYLVYTSFVGGDNNVHSKIMFSKSIDCGASWSQPSKLSESVAKNQGTTIAIDPGTGAIHIAWREFADSSGGRNAIIVARSDDGGRTFTKAQAISPDGYAMQPFDQVSSPLSFRTNAYPSIAVVPSASGAAGRVLVAWSARGFVAPTGTQMKGDARIVLASSVGGENWSVPVLADAHGGSGHQIMPALAFAGGKMALAYYDLRDDQAAIASGRFEDLVFEYGQGEFDGCMDAFGQTTPFDFVPVLNCIVNSVNRLSLRHTIDLRAAIYEAQCLSGGTCDPASSSVLGSQQVSRYPQGRASSNGSRRQLQYNRPNLPLFSKGRLPFIGDYIDIAGQDFIVTADGGWAWNTGHSANRPAPVFHVAWSDNRNVGTPRNANWEHFTPAILGPNAVSCVPGQVGVRNQDVYTAQLRPGLIVSAPQNSKRVAGLQRSFVVVAQNATDTEHAYELRAMPPAGVIASFDQFRGFGVGTPTESILVTIPRRSSISRTLFVSLENPPADPDAAPDVLVPVDVTQIPDASGSAFDMVYLNPDFENPDFANPDFENTELHNPDFENPDFENPDFENPDFENPDFENFSFTSSSITNPDFENPDFENPDFENPDFENPDFENPDFENPDFENPDFENPDFENPDFENPDFENPDFENGSFEVADTTWPVRNNGNTTSAYKTSVYVNDSPAGIKYQLVVRKIFTSPAAVCDATQNPLGGVASPGQSTVGLVAQSVPLVNIVEPNIEADPRSRAFNDPSRDNATFYLAPGERGLITLRAYCKQGVILPDGTVPACNPSVVASLNGRTALGVVAQGANCSTGTNRDELGDGVGGYSECVVDDGPPKDIYDPVAPTISVDSAPAVDDIYNDGSEPATFRIHATDNIAVAGVSCLVGATPVTLSQVSADSYEYTGAFPVGVTMVTCTASDLRPNEASVTFAVEVNDVTAPSFNVAPGHDAGAPYTPGNPAEAAGPNGVVVTYNNPTATDSNGGPVTVACASSDGTLSSGYLFPIGTTPIDCVATDDSNNAFEVDNMFAITVRDTTPPAIAINGPLTVTIEAGSSYADAGAMATDIVAASVTVSVANNIQSLVPGTYTVTYSATDPSGNTATATRTVIVRDTTPPSIAINGPVSVTIEAGTVYSDLGASATDLAAGAIVPTTSHNIQSLVPGTYAVTYTATDPSGNTATATRTVIVSDTTPPVVSVNGPAAAVEGNTLGGANVSFTSSASDVVSGAVATSCTPASNSVFSLGTTTVLCSATDTVGLTGTASTTITVVDTLAPIVTLAGESTVTVEAGAAYTDAGATSTDIVAGAIVPTASNNIQLLVPGSYTVTYTATDPSGNTATATRTVIVRDTTPPSIAINGPVSVTIEAGTVYSDLGASATDLAAGAIVPTTSHNIQSLVPGTYAVTYTATDPSGNTATATRTVIVSDTTPPVVSVNGPAAAVEGNTLGGAIVNFTSSGSDLVSGALAASCVPASGSVFPIGTTTVICSATDAAGVTGTGSVSITVVDTLTPIVTLTGGATVNVEAGAAYVDAGATAADIVSGPLAATVTGSVNTLVLGSYTMTYRATDAAGNIGTSTRTVNVVDTTAPVITEAATPSVLLWSPNKIMTPVTIAGVITDFSPTTATYKVVDEYKKVQPAGSVSLGPGGAYAFVVKLEAYRNGNDANGRVYTIWVTAVDAGGRSSTKSTVVLVPHNQ